MQGEYDGSVNIDTSIDFDGFDAGVKDLIQALKNLDATIMKLTEQMQGKFENLTANNATIQINNVSDAATAAANDTTDSTARIEHAVQDMERSMDHASGQSFSESIGQTTEMLGQQENVLNAVTEDMREYASNTRNSASELAEINLFPEITDASERSRKLYEEAEKYRHKLEELEARGLHSGDSEYDRTYDAMSRCHEESLAIERQQRGYTNAVENTQTTYENLSNTVERLKEKLAALKERGMGEGNDQFDAVYKQLKQAQNDLKEYRTGLNADATLESDSLDNLHNKVKKINAELIRLRSQGFGAGNETFDTKYQELIKAEDELKRYMAQLRETALSNNSQFDNLNNRVEELKARLAELRRQGMGFGNEDYDTAVREYQRAVDEMKEYRAQLLREDESDEDYSFKDRICAAFKRIGETASTTFKKIGSLGKQAFLKFGSLAVYPFQKITRSSKKSNKSLSALDNSLGKVVKKISRMAKTILFFRLFRQGLTNLRNYLGTALKANEEFTDSLGRIKGNLKTAFMPVYNAIMPALNTLMSALVKLSGYLAQITSLLFGSSIKAMQDQAAAIDQTAESAKKANKQLGKYDSLNVISSDSKEDSKTNNTIYGDIETSTKITDLIKSLEEAFKSGDYSKVGSIVADKINGALESLDISKIQSGAKKVAFGVGELLNGFVGTLNTSLLGKKIAELLNAGLTGANEFLTTFDFTKLGQKISEGINGFADSIDWDLAGETFANKWNAWIHGISGLIDTLDFSGIASGFTSGLNSLIYNIDWENAANAITTGVDGVVTSIKTFFVEFDWTELGFDFGTIINGFIDIDWGNVASTLSEICTKLMDLLGSAIESIDWKKLGEQIANFIINIDYVKLAKKIAKLLYTALVGLGDLLIGLGTKLGKWIWNGIKDAFKGIYTWGAEIGNSIKKGISSTFGAIGSWFGNRWKDIKNAFKGVYTWGKETFQSAKNGIVAAFGAIGSWFGNRWSDIKGAFGDIAGWFRGKFSDAWDGIKGAFSKVGYGKISRVRSEI